MKKAIILSFLVIGLATVFFFLRTHSATSPLSGETINLGEKSIPFAQAYGQLQGMLRGNSESQLLALTALERHPQLVNGTALLQPIVKLAIASEDYSSLDAQVAEARKTQSDELPNDPKLLEMGKRLEIRELALLIATVNGSPKALQTLNALKGSKSFSEQFIANNSARWLDLHGSPDAPKAGPFVLITRQYSEEAYTVAINELLNSPDIKSQITAVESITRNLSFQIDNERSIAFLITLLKKFFSNHKNTFDSDIQTLENETIRANPVNESIRGKQP